MSFDDLKTEIEVEKQNQEAEEAEPEWQEGDTCGKDGCSHEVHRVDHPRSPQLGTERHPEAPETEFVCTHHGVVASR